MGHIFISYSRIDSDEIDRIGLEVQKAGYTPWIDRRSIGGGDHWDESVVQAIAECDAFVIALSSSSSESKSVKSELDFALAENRKIIPVIIEPIEIPPTIRFRLGTRQRVDLFIPSGIGDLIEALGGNQSEPNEKIYKNVQTAINESHILAEKPLINKRLESTYVNAIGMTFVLIEPDKFMMGSNRGYGDTEPVHEVEIKEPFYLGKFLVTQAQWEAVMGDNPSFFRGPRFPVESISWNETQDFLEKITNANEKYRLPTEAEWEYACRAGSTTEYSFGDDPDLISEYGWHKGNSPYETKPVGQLKPNSWGLYDMHGNVWEWVYDWYGKDYYSESPSTDPQGPETGSFRVIRGGAWKNNAGILRSATRSNDSPDDSFKHLGFRAVKIVS